MFFRKSIVYWILLWLIVSQDLLSQAWVPTSKQGRKKDSLTVDYGATSYDRDVYFHISPNWSYNYNEDFGMSFSLPLNLMAIDNNPISRTGSTGSLRRFDYNENSDYLRSVNYIWYGQYEKETPGKTSFSFFAGDIRDGRIGHGTIVNQYNNNIRHDVYNVGVISDVNTDYGGVQFFSNSLYSRNVNVVRAYIKPLAIGRGIHKLYQIHKNQFDSSEEEFVGMMQFRGNVMDEAGRKSVLEELEEKKKKKPVRPSPIAKFSKMEIEDKDEWYNRLTIGMTRAFDGNTPLNLNYSQVGIPLRRENRDEPSVREDGRVSIDGVDLEYRLLNMKFVELTPYIDVNRIRQLQNSGGTHYGFMARFGGKDVNLIIKPELRRMSANYIPMYFDTFYEVERFHGNLTSDNPMNPKFNQAKGLNSTGGISGYFYTMLLNYYKYGFEVSYENYDGNRNSRIFIASYIPLGSSATLSFFYTKKGFNGTGEAFRVDNGSMGAIELSMPMGPIQFRLQNLRRWTFVEGEIGFRAFDEIRMLISSSYVF